MKGQIDFSEIQEMIKNKIGKDIVLSNVNENTIKASCTLSLKVPIIGRIDKNVKMNVCIFC